VAASAAESFFVRRYAKTAKPAKPPRSIDPLDGEGIALTFAVPISTVPDFNRTLLIIKIAGELADAGKKASAKAANVKT